MSRPSNRLELEDHIMLTRNEYEMYRFSDTSSPKDIEMMNELYQRYMRAINELREFNLSRIKNPNKLHETDKKQETDEEIQKMKDAQYKVEKERQEAIDRVYNLMSKEKATEVPKKSKLSDNAVATLKIHAERGKNPHERETARKMLEAHEKATGVSEEDCILGAESLKFRNAELRFYTTNRSYNEYGNT